MTLNYRHWLSLSLLPAVAAYLASFAIWRNDEGNVVTALHTGWGDLLFHIRAAIFFAEQGGWPRESFFLAGEPVGYAYASDWIVGWLWQRGLDISQAVALPTILLTTVLILAIQLLIWQMSRSLLAANLGSLLFIGFAGLSGYYLIPTLVADAANPWLTTLSNVPHEITAWHETKMIILNPFVMMLHQRAYLLGFPLFVVLVSGAWQWFKTGSTLHLGLLTLGGVLLAFVHPFTWVVWCLILGSWLGWTYLLGIRQYTKREVGVVAASLVVLGGVGYLIITSLQPSAATFLAWRPGWYEPSLWWPFFWLKNIGWYVILIPLAIRQLLRTNRLAAALVLSSLTPWVVGNLVQFTPWDWDTTKLFAPTWIIFAVAVALLLAQWWQRARWVGRGAIMGLVVLLTWSGLLEIARIFPTAVTPSTISTPAGEALGHEIRTSLPKDALILTAPAAHHPIFIYSGRPSFTAYEGWLWSQGWIGRYEERSLDTTTIYAGGPEAVAAMVRNQIDYVVIGPPEQSLQPNQTWFAARYPVVIHDGTYTVYDVRSRQ